MHHKLPTRYELAKTNPFQDQHCPSCGTPETFSHLLQCPGQLAQKFRNDLSESLDDYFTRMHTPATFRQHFYASMHHWLNPVPDPTITSQYNPPCFIHQNQLGWQMLPRGFFATSWRELYDTEISNDSILPRQKSIPFLSGLLRVLWQAQIEYWSTHLAEIHNNKTKSPLSDQMIELQSRIRQLHLKKHLCLQSHQHQYFHQDLDNYLQHATATQMRSYLHSYKKPITQSINMAKTTQTRSLFHFPGFSLHRPPPRHRLLPKAPSNSRPTSPANIITPPRGETIIRKHSRCASIAYIIHKDQQIFHQTHHNLNTYLFPLSPPPFSKRHTESLLAHSLFLTISSPDAITHTIFFPQYMWSCLAYQNSIFEMEDSKPR